MAGEPLINVAFDPASLGAIVKLAQFGAFLDLEMSVAMPQIGDIIVQAAVANTWTAFTNPTGQLASTIMTILDGPMAVQVGVGAPYGRRMEDGFVGTDSLGRTYDEAGKPYLVLALEQNTDQILQRMGLAAAEAFAKMGMPV